MAKPAPLPALREHLRSDDPAVRRTALAHVAAHGAAAASLAPDVARLLDDPDAAVQYGAMAAFRAVGHGVPEAVPILLEQYTRADAPDMLRARAVFLLGVVGRAAKDAIPVLREARGEDRRDALEALVRIAPDEEDPALAERVVEALFDPDYATKSAAARALPDGPRRLIERALAEAKARVADEASSHDALLVVIELAPRYPELALPIAREHALTRRRGAGFALLAYERSEAPIDLELARAMIDLAASADEAAARSIVALRARMPAVREHARAALVPLLGEAREHRRIAELSGALAALAPGSSDVVDRLIDQLHAGLQTSGVSLYDLGAIAEAIGDLSDASTATRASAALGAALDRSRALVRSDRSAGLDLQRRLQRGEKALARLGRTTTRARTDAERVDAAEDAREAKRARAVLPGIPKKARAAARPTVSAPTDAALRELQHARTRARARLAAEGLAAEAPPDRIARFVDDVVSATQTKRAEPDAIRPLAALFGDAIVRQLGWAWKLWSDGTTHALAVVAPNDTHVVLPGKLVRAKLEPGADVTLLLLFRMLVAGDLPPAEPGSLTLLA